MTEAHTPPTPSEAQALGSSVRLTIRLANLVRTARIYPDKHPALSFGVRVVTASITEVFHALGETEIHFMGRRLNVNNHTIRPPKGMILALTELAEFLGERNVGGLVIRDATTSTDVAEAISILFAEPGGGGPGPEVLNRRLTDAGIASFGFSGIRSPFADIQKLNIDPVLGAVRLYIRGLTAMKHLQQQGGVPSVMLELNRISRGLIEFYEMSPEMALTMMLESEVATYSLRQPLHMAILSIGLGHRLGVDGEALVHLSMAAMTADCGMRELPDPSVNLRGEPSGNERAWYQTHPLLSVHHMMQAGRLHPGVRRRLLVAFEHHLGVDGTGFPNTVGAYEQHPFSRFVRAADGFCNLVAETPWQASMSPTDALQTLRLESGTRYDRVIVDHLEGLLQEVLGIEDEERTDPKLSH